MIYVTHDQVEAMTLATRIVVMHGGQVQQIGAPAAVYERPENLFVAGFLGSPGMNFVQGDLVVEAGAPAFSGPPLAVDLAGYKFKMAPLQQQPVTLGVRPEHVRIGADGDHAARVHLVEPMGNHQVVWLDHAGLKFAAVVHEAAIFAAGESVRFSIDRTRVSLFDAATGQRL